MFNLCRFLLLYPVQAHYPNHYSTSHNQNNKDTIILQVLWLQHSIFINSPHCSGLRSYFNLNTAGGIHIKCCDSL